MVVNYKSTSPYWNTPQFNRQIEYLGSYVNRPVPADSTDEIVRISSQYERRPDLLSFELYGIADLWWVFAVRNPNIIQDPIYDLIAGIEIYIPTRQRMFNNILGVVG